MIKKSTISGLAFFLVSLLLSFICFSYLIPKSDPQLTKDDFLKASHQKLNYVAIGDSLTQGVGDTTHQGGFVPLVSQALESRYDYRVTSANFGVSGNTSTQILKRMQNQEAIRSALTKANLMTLSVGGNDVMAVIKKNLANLTLEAFSKAQKEYQKHLASIIDTARADNSDLPIYVIGIYNPFYLNFPDMTKMQDVIDQWNQATEEVCDDYRDVYFVPVNEALYKGIDGKEGVSQETQESSSVINDALFEGDHFHPNNIGYQIMSDQVMEKISETKASWKTN
ncbi:SGNH/GDSL hydrolase family protein [Streptococcus sp. zg-JUN1979]|uniref:SGNH/GDSL hydrolase family protein n=1 Tax=Streptococcus sp. zg-JUN1979 TaxID=3391450 RepID=UPI0039A61A8A